MKEIITAISMSLLFLGLSIYAFWQWRKLQKDHQKFCEDLQKQTKEREEEIEKFKEMANSHFQALLNHYGPEVLAIRIEYGISVGRYTSPGTYYWFQLKELLYKTKVDK